MLVQSATFSASGLAAQAMFEGDAKPFGGMAEAPGTGSPDGNDFPLSMEGLRVHRVTERVRLLITNQPERPEPRRIDNELASAEMPEDQQPQAVAKRIVDFIRAMAGGDPAMLEMLMEAAEQGFKEAEAIFGGQLPQVSYETMDLVRQWLEELMAEFTGQGQAQGEEFGPAATVEFAYEREETTLEYFSYTAKGAPGQAAAAASAPPVAAGAK